MSDGTDDRQIAQLIEAVQKLTVTAEQVAGTQAKLELLFIEALRKQDEDRTESRERMMKFDKEQEEFRELQKAWHERDKKWSQQNSWLSKNPWVQPRELANLSIMVAFAAVAIAL